MRGTILRRLLQVGIVVAVTTILLGGTAGLLAAAPKDHGNSGKIRANANGQVGDPNDTRPGWGFGDKNHVHTGPPGQGCDEDNPCSGGAGTTDSTEPATRFAVSAPSGVSANSSFSFTVTAQDQNNNTSTGYIGTVHFSSSDPLAALPANTTLTNGTGTFTATLNRKGNRTITATDTSNSSVTGTSTRISVK